MLYAILMEFGWDELKNEFLKANRGISFERVLIAMENGDILAVLQNPNQIGYRNQMMYVLNIDGYAWVVPFQDQGNVRRLITALPSRRYTKQYLSEGAKQ